MEQENIIDQLKIPYSLFIIDDEEGIADVIEMYLENNFSDELKIKTFTDPEIALKEMEQNIPNILITDVKMPKIMGDSLVQHCLKISSNMQIIVITGARSITVRTNCFLDGALGLISKPLEENEMINLVQFGINYFKRWEKIITEKNS